MKEGNRLVIRNLSLALIIGMFFFSMFHSVSAADFDNSKSYNKNSRTATITNSFGWGDEIASIKLDSPQNVYVFAGKDRQIAEFTINLNEDYDQAFKKMEFYNLKSGAQVNKAFTYKYKVITGSKQEPIYNSVCEKKTLINGTITLCENKVVGYNTVPIFEWKVLEQDKLSSLDSGEYVIGIFTDVEQGENGEWIPTLFGERISEWATWTESLNDGLALYYDFNSSRELLYGVYNLSNYQGAVSYSSSSCLISNCVQLSTDNNFYLPGNINTDFGASQNLTLNFWTRFTNGATTGPALLTRSDGGTGNDGYGTIGDNSNQNFYFNTPWTGSVVSPLATANNNQYYMVTYTKNESGYGRLYVNGTQIASGDSGFGSGQNNIYFGVNFQTGGQDHNGQFDEMGIWNRTLSQTEITQLYNTGSGITYSNSGQPIGANVTTISTVYNSTAYEYFNESFSILVNYNTTLYSSSSAVLSYNGSLYNTTRAVSGANIRFTRSIVIPTNVQLVENKTFFWIFNISNATASAIVNSNQSNQTVNQVITSQTYNGNTLSGSQERFEINLTLPAGRTINLANLLYNSTLYSGTLSNVGDNWSISKTLTVPGVTAITNKTFNWNITLTGGFNITAPTKSQIINPFSFDDCSTSSNVILNYTLKDEETQTLINTSLNPNIQIDLQVYDANKVNTIINFSKNYNLTNNAVVCYNSTLVNITTGGYRLYSLARYEADNYAAEFHNIQNLTLISSVIPQNITLYDLNLSASTEFLIIYQDNEFLPVESAIIDITRKYIGEGVFKSVESPKTDKSGQAKGHFDQNGVIYTINVYKEGTLLATFPNINVVCQNPLISQCSLSLNAFSSGTPVVDFDSFGNLQYSTTFNATQRRITLPFTTTDGSNSNVTLIAIKYDRFGNQTVCADSLTSSSGTLTCNIPSSFGNATVQARIYKDNVIISEQLMSISPAASQTFAGVNVFFVLLLLLTIPFIALSSPIVTIVMVIFGLILSGLLYLNSGTTFFGPGSTLLWFIVTGGILIYKFSRRE